MNFSDIPSRIIKAFGVNGLKNPIATDSSTTTDNNGVATFDKGFPPITMQPLSAGGIPPSGKDMNGVLYATTLKQQWSDAGMGYVFNNDFAAAISGYPKGSVLPGSQLDIAWLNTLDGNVVNPESTSSITNWVPAYSYGTTTISGLSSSSITLIPAQAAKERLILSGTLNSNININFPAWMKSWTVVNNCTGNFVVICKTSSGSGVPIQTGTMARIYGDGANIRSELPIQVADGVKSSQAVNLGQFASTLSSSGEQVLPSGLIIKWGESTISTGKLVVNFTNPFPNACLFMFPTHLLENTNDYVIGQCVSRSASGGVIAVYRNAPNSAPISNTSSVTTGWAAFGF
jgi:hypothetical protein